MPRLFPRCQRMTAVTSSQVLTKRKWRHLLTNTTLTGPMGLMALMVSCHLRVMMNTKHWASFLPTAACSLVCTVLMCVKTTSPIWYWKILLQNNVNAVAFQYVSVQWFSFLFLVPVLLFLSQTIYRHLVEYQITAPSSIYRSFLFWMNEGITRLMLACCCRHVFWCQWERLFSRGNIYVFIYFFYIYI